jgi:branched-chain amino acid transport system substrate-binding protein
MKLGMKIGMKRAAVALSTCVIAVSGLAIVSSGTAFAKGIPTYEIGFEGPLSGGNAATGLYEKYGAQLAVKQWNANPKRKFNVQLVPGDDQGDPTIAPSVATGFALNPKVVAVVGPAFSGATVATLGIYGANHIAEVSPSATRV